MWSTHVTIYLHLIFPPMAKATAWGSCEQIRSRFANMKRSIYSVSLRVIFLWSHSFTIFPKKHLIPWICLSSVATALQRFGWFKRQCNQNQNHCNHNAKYFLNFDGSYPDINSSMQYMSKTSCPQMTQIHFRIVGSFNSRCPEKMY